MKEIGTLIRQRRKQQQLSQELLAERLFISQATLSNIENNRSVPDVLLLKQFAEELDFAINKLVPFKNEAAKEKSNQSDFFDVSVIDQLIEKTTAPYILLNDQYKMIIEEKDNLITELREQLQIFQWEGRER